MKGRANVPGVLGDHEEGHVEVTQREATASEPLRTLDLTLGNSYPKKDRISEKAPPLNMHFFINCTVVDNAHPIYAKS